MIKTPVSYRFHRLMIFGIILTFPTTVMSQFHFAASDSDEVLMADVTQPVIREVLKISSSSPRSAEEMALVYLNVGEILSDLEEGAKARAFYRMALQLVKESKKAGAYKKISDLFREINEHDEAFTYRNKSQKTEMSTPTKFLVIKKFLNHDAPLTSAFDEYFDLFAPEEYPYLIKKAVDRDFKEKNFRAVVDVVNGFRQKLPKLQEEQCDQIIRDYIVASQSARLYDDAVAMVMCIDNEQKRKHEMQTLEVGDMKYVAEQLDWAVSVVRDREYVKQYIPEFRKRYPKQTLETFDQWFHHIFNDHLARQENIENPTSRFWCLYYLVKWAYLLKEPEQARQLSQESLALARKIQPSDELSRMPSLGFGALGTICVENSDFDTLKEIIAELEKSAPEVKDAETRSLLDEYLKTFYRAIDEPEQIERILSDDEMRMVYRLAGKEKYDQALVVINENTARLADRIEMLGIVIDSLNKSGDKTTASRHAGTFFEWFDRLKEKVAENPLEDRQYRFASSSEWSQYLTMTEAFSHELVEKCRRHGDNLFAWELGKELYYNSTSHESDYSQTNRQIIFLINRKSEAGDFEKVILLSEGQPELLGRVICEMCRQGRQEEADKLIDQGLESVAANGKIAHEMIVALVACRRYEQAVQLVRQASREEADVKRTDGQPNRNAFMMLVKAMFIFAEEKRLLDILDHWPDELEKVNAIHSFITWKEAGNCPELELSDERIESWKNALVSFARQEKSHPSLKTKHNLLIARDLIRLEKKREATELLSEALELVLQEKNNPKFPQQVESKIETVKKIGTMLAETSECVMAEKAFLEVLEICQAAENANFLNRMKIANGILKAYSAGLREEKFDDPSLKSEYMTRSYNENTVFSPQYLSLTEK